MKQKVGEIMRTFDKTEAPKEDFLLRASRAMALAGLFMVSLLVVRVGGFITVGDLLLMGSAGLLAVAPRPLSKKPAPPPPNRVTIGLLIFVGGLLAASVSPNTADSMEILLRVLYVAIILPWQMRRLFHTHEHLAQACVAVAMGAAFCGFGTILQNRLGPNIIPGADVTNAGRYSGFTAHVSDTGGITALAVVAGVAGLGIGASKGAKFLSLGIIAGGLVGLILSGSVSGMLSAGIGIIAVMMLRGVSTRRLILVGCAGAAATYFASGVLSATQNALNPMERFYQAVGLSPAAASGLNTTASRLETDRLGWESFLKNPWTGVGLDPESAVVDHLFNLSVHNFLIGALHQGGWVFALGLLLAALSLLLPGLRKQAPDALRAQTAGMAVAAVTFAITAPSFFNRYFWVPLALLGVQTLLPTRPPSLQEPKGKATRPNKSQTAKLSPGYAKLQRQRERREAAVTR
jgi:hypothetical protein